MISLKLKLAPQNRFTKQNQTNRKKKKSFSTKSPAPPSLRRTRKKNRSTENPKFNKKRATHPLLPLVSVDRTTMRPHINIGQIGHVDYGKTTLTEAITAALSEQQRSEPAVVHEEPSGITINTNPVEYVNAPEPPARKTNSLMRLLAMSEMIAGSFKSCNPSSADIRHDPNRPKTPKDLERMETAQKKRDRKAAKRNSSHNTQKKPCNNTAKI